MSVETVIHIHGSKCGCADGCLCSGCDACKDADSYETSCGYRGCCNRKEHVPKEYGVMACVAREIERDEEAMKQVRRQAHHALMRHVFERTENIPEDFDVQEESEFDLVPPPECPLRDAHWHFNFTVRA